MTNLEKIQMILRSAGIEDLLADGAPEDEYDSKALEMWQTIKTCQGTKFTSQQLAQTIQSIWERSFAHEPADQLLDQSLHDMYHAIARQILEESTDL